MGNTRQSLSICHYKDDPYNHVLSKPSQQSEMQQFLKFTSTYGLEKAQLIPGDILFHKDFGGESSLHDTISSLTKYGISIRQLIRGFKGECETDCHPSPYNLHPYVYIGDVACPDGVDAGDISSRKEPCVAHSSRFYPVGEPINTTISGVRRKKFRTIEKESLFIWRIINDASRLRVARFALAATNPYAVKLAGKSPAPLIPYATNTKLFKLWLSEMFDFSYDQNLNDILLNKLALQAIWPLVDLGGVEQLISKEDAEKTMQYARILASIAASVTSTDPGFACSEFVSVAVLLVGKGIQNFYTEDVARKVRETKFWATSSSGLAHHFLLNSRMCSDEVMRRKRISTDDLFDGYGYKGSFYYAHVDSEILS